MSSRRTQSSSTIDGLWRPMLACAALAAAVPACNQLYGVETTAIADAAPDADLRPDRDQDGIADVEDLCIAVESDGTEDSDGDGLANLDDPCPFIPGPEDDMDGDGVGDRCDRFATRGGDRTLCTMRFLSAELNVSLWKAREGETGWAVASGSLIGFQQTPPLVTSVVAQDRITPTTGTTSLDLRLNPILTTFIFRVWVSAGVLASAADVGCDVTSNASGMTVTPFGANVLANIPGPPFTTGGAAVRIVYQPGKAGPNLACGVVYGSGTATAAAHFDGELGAQGFAVLNGAIILNGVVVVHRDDQPDFR